MNILIAEDTEDSRIILKKTLEGAGFNVRDAGNGAEALHMANESPPDMIISDILMPEMDGFEFCRLAKRSPELRRIPFIFYTATYTDPKDERLAMSLGASRFILKPTEADEFLRILKEVIHEYKEEHLHVPRMPLSDEEDLHKMHDDSLRRKLEKKIVDLENERNALLISKTELKASEDRYREVVEGTADLITRVDGDSRFLYVNPVAERIFGVNKERCIGMSAFQFIHPDDREMTEAWFRECTENKLKKATLENRQVHKDTGEVFHTLWTSIFYYDEKGSVTGVNGIAHDITERKQSESEREHLYDEVNRINEELKQILYVTSHDLRSPLVNIQGYCKELELSLKEIMDILKVCDVPSGVRSKIDSIIGGDIPEAVNYINAGIVKINALLSGLLNLSRLGQFELTIEEIEMNSFLHHVMNNLEFRIKKTGVQVDISDLPARRADLLLMNQIFTNLLDNALKYISPERNGNIRISGYRKDGQSVYCVEDNGIGIAPEYQKKIFELFHQLDPAKSEGEGMGLSIIRLAAERLHGSVWVESQSGIGSKFFVSLPA